MSIYDPGESVNTLTIKAPPRRGVSAQTVAAIAGALALGSMGGASVRARKVRRPNKYIADRDPNQPQYKKIQGRERNAPCSCGSGKKMKKCCGV